MRTSAGAFLGGSGTSTMILAAIAAGSVALALTVGAWPLVPKSPEPEPVCAMGYEFVDGQCVLVTPPVVCPEGTKLEGDTCTPEVTPGCPDGYQYIDGQCVEVQQPPPPPPDPGTINEPPGPEPAVIPFEKLHGVNYIDPVLYAKEQDVRLPVQTAQVEKLVPAASEAGFNVFRIPVVWEAYVGNEDNFIDELVTVVKQANSHDIFVWLDFHQYDATSNWPSKVSRGRGFPEFIVSCYHPKGDYERDPEVRAFWSDYYDNRIRDSGNSCERSLDVWSLQADFMDKLISAVDQYPNVIGYEILNEPHVWKDRDYDSLGQLHTEIAKEMRKHTDKVIIFTRETTHGFGDDGKKYGRKLELEYKLLPKDPEKNVMYIPHLYDLGSIEDHVSRWKADQARWKAMGYDVKIAVGEWSPQPPQLEEGNAVTQENMDNFLSVWSREGWMSAYWAYGGFSFGEGNVLVKQSGKLTNAGEYYLDAIHKFY